MGFNLVNVAVANGGKLGPRPRLILIAMAHYADDAPNNGHDAGTYYGGWERLALWLGHQEPDGAAYQAIQRAITDLRAAGLVVRIQRGSPGHNAVYALNLPPLTHATE